MLTLPNSITQFLDEPYMLTQEQIDFYQKNRFIKLKSVLNPETVTFFNAVISQQVNEMNQEQTALEDRTTYGKAFLQLFNLWVENAVVKQLIFSKRIAKIAADLMEVNGVRLYHDQALFKEGGGGITLGTLTNIIGLYKPTKPLRPGFPCKRLHSKWGLWNLARAAM